MHPEDPPTETHTADPVAELSPRCVICDTDLSEVYERRRRCLVCRTPAECSMPGGTLAHSDVFFVRKLRRGSNALVMGILFGLIAAFLYAFTAGQGTPLHGNSQLVIALSSLAATISTFVGWWWLTTADERLAGPYDGRALRAWLRWSLAVSMSVTVLHTVLVSIYVPAGASPPSNLNPGIALLTVGLLLLTVVMNGSLLISQTLYIKWLATRVPSKKAHAYASRALKYIFWLVIGGVFFGMFGLLSVVVPSASTALLMLVPMLLALAAAVAMSIYYIAMLVTTWRALSAVCRQQTAQILAGAANE